MEERVAKAVSLLEFVRDLPRTESNIAATLIHKVGDPAPTKEVTSALETLEKAEFVKSTEDGWKLQTAQEKGWSTERNGYLEPRPKDRNEIVRDSIEDIFSEPKLKLYKYGDIKNFKVGVSVNGVNVGDEGQIPLLLITSDAPDDLENKKNETRNESRQENNKNNPYWLFSLNGEIDSLVANLHASRQMVSRYDQLRAQNKITNEEAACLQSEKHEVNRYQNRLREKLAEAYRNGTGMFCLLYTSPSPRDGLLSRMPSSA